MKKILLISHFNLAGGIKDTIRYFSEESANEITAINAYTTDEDPRDQLKLFFDTVGNSERIYIFTDILGGSVNQYCLQYIAENDNVFLFTGMNLPIVLQATAFSGNESIDEIKRLEQTGKSSIIFMNEYNFEPFSDDDE